MDYKLHDVKRDPGGTGCIAVRTIFDVEGEKAWHVFRPGDGASHFVANQDVAHWIDLK